MAIDTETGDDLIDDTTVTDDAAGAGAAGAGDAPLGEKTALDVIGEAIEEVGKPRTIVPKQEEQDQNDTRQRNADGTFKTETDEEKKVREDAEEAARLAKETPEEKAARLAAETPEQKTEREAKEAAAAKKPDAVNDPIPEGLNKRTAARMQELVDTVKQQAAIVESHTLLFDTVREAGSPDEFAAMIKYMKGVRSNDPKVLEQAYTMLQGELRGLAVRMGKPLYEVNLLRDPANQDLVDEIRDGKITNNRAHELALARETQKRASGATQAATAASSAETDRQTGIGELNVLETSLIARDGEPAYRAKRAVLESSLAGTMAEVSPLKWKSIFAKAYEGLKLAPPTAAAVIPPVVKTQPQRPKQPAGSGAGNTATEPKSAIEAMNIALGG